MDNYITAIFKDGVLKPLETVDLKESQVVTIKIISSEKAVLESTGIIKGDSKYIHEIAESKELLEWNP